MTLAVLLYVPNIIGALVPSAVLNTEREEPLVDIAPVVNLLKILNGYIRLSLILASWLFWEKWYLFLSLYSIQVLLDGVDGWIARKLGQCSSFGAWLDVVADNIGRSLVWTRLSMWGTLIICVEWLVFSSTHNKGAKWKESFGKAPFWVKAVMDNGFRTPQGALVIAGLHFLPILLYVRQAGLTLTYPYLHIPLLAVIIVVAIGRCLCLAVELWVLFTHILDLVHSDENDKVNSLTKPEDTL